MEIQTKMAPPPQEQLPQKCKQRTAMICTTTAAAITIATELPTRFCLS